MSPLTPKQKRLLDFVARHIRLHGYAPSQREIADALGFRSLGTVQNYLVRLEREGLLARDWNARRGVRVRRPEAGPMEIPLVGSVAAGKPIEAVPVPDTLEIPLSMAGEGHYALRVRGNSMVGDGIIDGDFVVVRKQETAQDGQTVVAILDGEATVKKLFRRGGRVELHPANPEMRPIVVKEGAEFRVEGVVVGVIRHCG